jgi:hypothetical protein
MSHILLRYDKIDLLTQCCALDTVLQSNNPRKENVSRGRVTIEVQLIPSQGE